MSSRSSVDTAPARCSGGHGSIAVGDSDVYLSHARGMFINSPYKFHYRAQHLYSLIIEVSSFS